jgi:HSP20 family molecular chaperone IbpA
MAIDRRNPFISLREGMERLLQESSMVPSSIFDVFGQRSFPVDLAEAETQFVLRASLPGVKPDDVQITARTKPSPLVGPSRKPKSLKASSGCSMNSAQAHFSAP